MPLSPHTRLGPYEIISAIGAGGMGEVYQACDTRLDRTVAIKVLPEHRSGTPQARERFEREAKAISSLSHPHICPLYDVGHQDGIDYLVMEHLEGETLASRLKKGPLPPERAIEYAIQIADALDTAHRHGVIHRDLKPGNIMLVKTGTKLLDFGLAKVRAAEAVVGMTALPTETTPLTSEGAILGTLQYMAPEQLEGKEADARTDIFALGAVFYEMATGRRAFEGKSQASLISAIMSAEPPPISTLQTMTPPALDHVVRSCLAKDPEGRWQNARDCETELKWIASGSGVSQAAAPASLRRLRKRERLAWIIAGCFFVGLTAALTFVRTRRAPEARVVPFKVTLPDRWGGALGTPLLSPDGRYVAIPDISESSSRIWIHPVNSLATNPLPGTDGGNFPCWSPDSRELAFSTGTALKKISITGGDPQTISSLPASSCAWNRDGVILFNPASVPAPLYKVSAEGGDAKPVTVLDRARQETNHACPQFLPDGRHFIYLAEGNAQSSIATYLGSLDSPKVKRMPEIIQNAMYASPGYLIFLQSSSLMAQRFDGRNAELSGDVMVLAPSVAWETSAPIKPLTMALRGQFSISENGALAYLGTPDASTQLVWFDRSGKRLETVGEPAVYTSPAISPDQKMVAVGKLDPKTTTRDIWIIDFQRSTSSRLTFDPGDDLNPAWSPDGARIAFTSDRKGQRDIYVKAAGGGGEDQVLLQSEKDKHVEHWSSDGQYLLYGIKTEEWLFSLRENKSIPLPKFTEDQARFSPNTGPPRWLAYSSRETGVRQVYVRSFAGALSGSGGKWQVSTNGGAEPYWRGDGKELFYLNGNKLMAVEVNGDGESFHPGIPKLLFETPLGDPTRNRYDVASDGKRFLMNVLVESNQGKTFTVVLNWPALLKRE